MFKSKTQHKRNAYLTSQQLYTYTSQKRVQLKNKPFKGKFGSTVFQLDFIGHIDQQACKRGCGLMPLICPININIKIIKKIKNKNKK